jgi:hypothetical protein
MGLPETLSPRALDLAATPDLKALNVGMVARSCHEIVTTK